MNRPQVDHFPSGARRLQAPPARQRLGRGQLIAGFEVSINCRFWVSTEAIDRDGHTTLYGRAASVW